MKQIFADVKVSKFDMLKVTQNQKISDKKMLKFLKCEIYIINFKLKGDLNVHKKFEHTEVKKFECQLCPSKFGEKGTLTKHINEVHENKKPFDWQLCPLKFGRKGT